MRSSGNLCSGTSSLLAAPCFAVLGAVHRCGMPWQQLHHKAQQQQKACAPGCNAISTSNTSDH
jgi:hypothetical protein